MLSVEYNPHHQVDEQTQPSTQLLVTTTRTHKRRCPNSNGLQSNAVQTTQQSGSTHAEPKQQQNAHTHTNHTNKQTHTHTQSEQANNATSKHSPKQTKAHATTHTQAIAKPNTQYTQTRTHITSHHKSERTMNQRTNESTDRPTDRATERATDRPTDRPNEHNRTNTKPTPTQKEPNQTKHAPSITTPHRNVDTTNSTLHYTVALRPHTHRSMRTPVKRELYNTAIRNATPSHANNQNEANGSVHTQTNEARLRLTV